MLNFESAKEKVFADQDIKLRNYWGREFIPESVFDRVIEGMDKKREDPKGLKNLCLWVYDHVCCILLDIEEMVGDRKFDPVNLNFSPMT